MRKKKIEESQLLIPKSYREKQAKAARKRYTKSIIRFQFPDGVVLQGVFGPWEQITALYEVSPYNCLLIMLHLWFRMFMKYVGQARIKWKDLAAFITSSKTFFYKFVDGQKTCLELYLGTRFEECKIISLETSVKLNKIRKCFFIPFMQPKFWESQKSLKLFSVIIVPNIFSLVLSLENCLRMQILKMSNPFLCFHFTEQLLEKKEKVKAKCF